MDAYFSLVLHAHLPFVRHPEHDRFLEENWLFEAITETYIPLLQTLESWQRDGMKVRLALTLTPTLCSMLQDPLLQTRYQRQLNAVIELAQKEVHRTLWERPFHELALFYLERFEAIRKWYQDRDGDLLRAFRNFQDNGFLEILTCAATHALLPLLQHHPPSLRAQIRVACDHYRHCFGCDARGIWLPECAYGEGLETLLQEAKLRWFVTDTHGVLYANPKPRYGIFAPIWTPNGVAAFGRDRDSAKQVWSRHEGYPGDLRYRDFYRDAGFDLDLEYLRPYLSAPEQRGFTGIKYHRITGPSADKAVYNRAAALSAADEHATHFLSARIDQFSNLVQILDQPPLVLSPYDAELFGHWWYEGPEFLNLFVRKAYYDQNVFRFITPGDYLDLHPTHQVAKPAPSSWGEGGFYGMWLNETNEWIYRHLSVAQERMTELTHTFSHPTDLEHRALKQAGRELLLAQASDWPFILRTGTSPDYARRRVRDHLLNFCKLYDQLKSRQLDPSWLADLESRDNIFPDLNYRYWA
jgi:1,4-alpha-glucan branching enzyme